MIARGADPGPLRRLLVDAVLDNCAISREYCLRMIEVTLTPGMLAAATASAGFWAVLVQLVLLLSVALLLGVLFERLGQSAILGYLLAGTLMGPAVFGVVQADSGVPILAELGVTLLLFAIGLEFSVKRLVRLGGIAVGGGSLQVGATLALAALLAWAMGVPGKAALAIGAMAALSSTACVLRLLVDRGEIDSVHGRSALGILLLQDVAVVPLVLMVTMLSGSGSVGELGWKFLEVMGLILGLVLGFYILTNVLLPRFLKLLSLSRDRELLIVLAVILALGSASAAHALEISPALGAFIAGMMLAESPYATQIRTDIGALRALFLTLFFTTVGMLGDPVWIAAHIGPVVLVVLLLVVGKATVVTLIACLFKVPLRHAVATGIALAQVGEFGLVIGGIAQSNGLLDEDPFRLVVSATLLTLFLTPIQVRLALKLGGFVEGLLSGRSRSGKESADDEEGERSAPDILVAGFGPAGQGVVRALAERGESVLVIDLRPANIDLARSMGYEAVLGDATNLDVLLHHGVTRASVIVVTVPDHRAAAQIVGSVRTLAPLVTIVARARYHFCVAELRESGADLVIDEEGITAKHLTAGVREVLQKLRGSEPH